MPHTWSEAPSHSPNYLVPDQVAGRQMARFKRERPGAGLDSGSRTTLRNEYVDSRRWVETGRLEEFRPEGNRRVYVALD